MRFLPAAVFLVLALIPASAAAGEALSGGRAIEPTLSAAQVLGRYAEARGQFDAAIKAIIDLPSEERGFANTVKALDLACGAYDSRVVPLMHLAQVSDDLQARAAARSVAEQAALASAELWTRPDLFGAVDDYARKGRALSAANQKLLDETMRAFREASERPAPRQTADLGRARETLAALSAEFDKLVADRASRPEAPAVAAPAPLSKGLEILPTREWYSEAGREALIKVLRGMDRGDDPFAGVSPDTVKWLKVAADKGVRWVKQRGSMTLYIPDLKAPAGMLFYRISSDRPVFKVGGRPERMTFKLGVEKRWKDARFGGIREMVGDLTRAVNSSLPPGEAVAAAGVELRYNEGAPPLERKPDNGGFETHTGYLRAITTLAGEPTLYVRGGKVRQVERGDTLVVSGTGRLDSRGKPLAVSHAIPSDLGPRLDLVVHYLPVKPVP